MGWKDSWGDVSPFALMADQPTLSLTLTLRRTLWGDQCLDVMACEMLEADSADIDVLLGKALRWFIRFGMLWAEEHKTLGTVSFKFNIARTSIDSLIGTSI